MSRGRGFRPSLPTVIAVGKTPTSWWLRFKEPRKDQFPGPVTRRSSGGPYFRHAIAAVRQYIVHTTSTAHTVDCHRSFVYFHHPSSQTSMPDPSALIAHIVSQTRQNVEFLISQGEISRDVGQGILAKLPTASDVALRDLSEQTRRMTIPSPPLSQPSIDYTSPPSGPPARRNVPPQPPTIHRAKALWSYNENGLVGIVQFTLLPKH